MRKALAGVEGVKKVRKGFDEGWRCGVGSEGLKKHKSPVSDHAHRALY